MKTMVSTAGGQAAEYGSRGEAPDGLAPGSKAGPWIVERELGRGGMGAVYAVVHEEIGKRAALKVVHSRLLTPGFNADRMLLEARVVNQVGHPNIVDIFETGRFDDGRPYIVMERLEGQPLSCRADDGKILPDQVIAILLQICDALIAAHAAGIVHRDLKLDNVFLVDNPEDLSTPRVKLLDWGIAKVLSHDVRHTVDGQLVGTPQYLSPEQARGSAVSPQTDVYSLGVMAYELFLEQLPFEAETSAEIMALHLRAIPPPPHELWPDIPPALEALLLQMLAKAPDERPTMLEVARRLEAIHDDLRARQQRTTLASPAPGSSGSGPRALTPPVPADAGFVIPTLPRVARRMQSPELAATLPAELVGSRRWQFALGAFAIVAATALFLVSRTDESSAATASGAVAEPPSVEVAPEQVLPPLPSGVAEPAPIVPPNLAVLEPSVLVPAEAPVIEVAPAAQRTRLAPSLRTSARPASFRPSVRNTPAMPRRGTKVDPDGTFDPYQ